MPTDKEIKKQFKIESSKNPDKYYATAVLKAEGFVRKQCSCSQWFWTANKNQKTCGDAACSGGFRFFENNPCKEKLSYLQVWQKFSKMFKELGYTPIKRYPVVARWRDDMDFVIASIADFQPYVVSGEVSPPANPLVVPQFCLRFGDIDNVGITGSHMTCFNMIGQHMFVSPKEWDQNKVFKHIKKWLNEGLGLADSEITFHEDAWAGGGNFGPCMEFFSRGVELGNQVYILYEQTPKGPQELRLKVLDMGMGMERCAWFSQGTPTIYDATFPHVMDKLMKVTGLSYDKNIMKKYVPFAGLLNIDEVEDVQKAWKEVAKKVGIGVDELKKAVLPMAALYSIAEHARGLLIALTDGALPSNVGGCYNLRILARRAFSFIDKYNWNIELSEVCRWHAEELKEEFPELSENLEEVEKILHVEKEKYRITSEKSKQAVAQIIKTEITKEKLLQLYDSQGIPPEIIKEEAEKLGKEITIPDNFYAEVANLHEKTEQEHATEKEEKLPLDDISETEAMYYDDYTKIKFTAKVVKIINNNVVLDKTAFYPTSGGQLHDTGSINTQHVINIFKQGSVIVHTLSEAPHFKVNDRVNGEIDFERRKQLAQHHTAAHIVNAAARKVLGKHINQAGAKKTEEKAHLDITHYQSLTDEELKKIEHEANILVKKSLPVTSEFLARDTAEKKYGMAIYQGGAVPGKKIRIITILNTDVEACGGTHLKNTSEIGEIKVIKSAKIQDGIVRLTFTAGKAAQNEKKGQENIIEEAVKLLGVKASQVPIRAQELFDKWKLAVKKGKVTEAYALELTSTDEYLGNALQRTAEILKTQPEHIIKTLKRFMQDLEEMKNKLK
jgi:alanyl-tRNA synthetase